MPKTHADYTEPLNLLVTQTMKHTLNAIKYYRGVRSVGEATKDILQEGITRWLASLSPADRKRFDEILSNVQIAGAYSKQINNPFV